MSDAKECFLVMPIRKPGTEEHEHFRALRDTVLEPVMNQLEYHVTRADDIAQSGAITADILKRLATADLVIADLTNLNANVFYELGIRHTLRGQGTIMIVDTSRTAVPFDLLPYRVIEFVPDLRGIEKLREMLVRFTSAISGDTSDPTKDNPVHDFLSSLPDNIYAQTQGTSEGNLRQEVSRLRSQIRQYAERFGADLAISSRQDAAIDVISSELMRAQRGELPVDLFYTARVLAREEDRVQFLATVRQLLDASPSAISADNWSDLATDAERLALPEVAMVLHEQAVGLRPRDETLKRYQLSTLAGSADPSLRERARQELALLLGITITDDGVILPDKLPLERLKTVGIMLDAYIHDNLYDVALKITTALVERYPDSTVALRNHGRVLEEVGRGDEALNYYQRAFQALDVDDTSVNWYASRLAGDGRVVDAIAMYLTACRLDPDDPFHFVSVASQCAVGSRARLMGRTQKGPSLPEDVGSDVVTDFVSAALSCPVVGADVVDRARVAVDYVEAAGSLIDHLIELKRGTADDVDVHDVDVKLYSRAERVQLVLSLMERISNLSSVL